MSILDPHIVDEVTSDIEVYGEAIHQFLRVVYNGMIDLAINHCKVNQGLLTYPAQIGIEIRYYFGMGKEPITGDHGFVIYIADPAVDIKATISDDDYTQFEQEYYKYIGNYYEDCEKRGEKPLVSYYSLYAVAGRAQSHLGEDARRKLLVSRSKDEYQRFMDAHPELIYDLSTLREMQHPDYEYYA